MNVVELRDQMTKKSIEWEKQLGKGVGQEIGEMVRAWVGMIERLTAKLVNPRKDEEYIENKIITYGDKLLAEIEKKVADAHSIHPDEDPNIRRNY